MKNHALFIYLYFVLTGMLYSLSIHENIGFGHGSKKTNDIILSLFICSKFYNAFKICSDGNNSKSKYDTNENSEIETRSDRKYPLHYNPKYQKLSNRKI